MILKGAYAPEKPGKNWKPGIALKATFRCSCPGCEASMALARRKGELPAEFVGRLMARRGWAKGKAGWLCPDHRS